VNQTLTRRLGEIVVTRGFVSEEQLQEALRIECQEGKQLSEILVATGVLSADELNWALSEVLGIPYVELREDMVDFELARSLPEEILRRHVMFPILRADDELTVVLADPTDDQAIDALEMLTRSRVVTGVASRDVILQLLDKVFPPRPRPGLGRFVEVETARGAVGSERSDVAEVYALLLGALRESASEVHVEPLSQELRVRYRLEDGRLVERARLLGSFSGALTARLRTLAGLRGEPLPCEAVVRTRLEGEDVELNLLFCPSLHGEAVTVRIWRNGLQAPTFEALNLDVPERNALGRLTADAGLIVVSGSVARGRAALLYALAQAAAGPTKRVVTLERAVSFEVPGFLQVEVPGDFGEGAAKILRHPADVAVVEDLRTDAACLAAIGTVQQGTLVLGGLAAPSNVAALAHLWTLDVPRVPLFAVTKGLANVSLRGAQYTVSVLPMTETLRQEWLVGPDPYRSWTSRTS
jgi:type IV pilus assembly protein PilB